MNKILLLIAALLLQLPVFSQNVTGPQMADSFREDGKIAVVIAVISIIFICLAVYLFAIDKKLGKLEKELKQKETPRQAKS